MVSFSNGVSTGRSKNLSKNRFDHFKKTFQPCRSIFSENISDLFRRSGDIHLNSLHEVLRLRFKCDFRMNRYNLFRSTELIFYFRTHHQLSSEIGRHMPIK